MFKKYNEILLQNVTKKKIDLKRIVIFVRLR